MEPLTMLLLGFLFAGAAVGTAFILVEWERFKRFVVECVTQTLKAMGAFLERAQSYIKRVIGYVSRDGDYAVIEVLRQVHLDPSKVYSNIQRVNLNDVPEDIRHKLMKGDPLKYVYED